MFRRGASWLQCGGGWGKDKGNVRRFVSSVGNLVRGMVGTGTKVMTVERFDRFGIFSGSKISGD